MAKANRPPINEPVLRRVAELQVHHGLNQDKAVRWAVFESTGEQMKRDLQHAEKACRRESKTETDLGFEAFAMKVVSSKEHIREVDRIKKAYSRISKAYLEEAKRGLYVSGFWISMEFLRSRGPPAPDKPPPPGGFLTLEFPTRGQPPSVSGASPAYAFAHVGQPRAAVVAAQEKLERAAAEAASLSDVLVRRAAVTREFRTSDQPLAGFVAPLADLERAAAEAASLSETLQNRAAEWKRQLSQGRHPLPADSKVHGYGCQVQKLLGIEAEAQQWPRRADWIHRAVADLACAVNALPAVVYLEIAATGPNTVAEVLRRLRTLRRAVFVRALRTRAKAAARAAGDRRSP